MSEHTAWAAMSGNDLGGDAGILVLDGEGGQVAREIVDLALDGPDGDLDSEAADLILAGLGWTRTGDWVESGGQWAARCEPVGGTTVGELAVQLGDLYGDDIDEAVGVVTSYANDLGVLTGVQSGGQAPDVRLTPDEVRHITAAYAAASES